MTMSKLVLLMTLLVIAALSWGVAADPACPALKVTATLTPRKLRANRTAAGVITVRVGAPKRQAVEHINVKLVLPTAVTGIGESTVHPAKHATTVTTALAAHNFYWLDATIPAGKTLRFALRVSKGGWGWWGRGVGGHL